MVDKLKEIEARFEVVGQMMIDPDIIGDQNEYKKVAKEYKDLSKVVKVSKQYQAILEGIEEAKEIIKEEKDPEMKDMAKMELDELEPQVAPLEEKIKEMLIPKDPNDAKNVVLEIRAGAGGDEASIFAGDLFRLYQRFCEKVGWKLQVIDFTEGTSGGYKEIISNVSGEDVYGRMKYESGVHRVQRVPATETQGRVHTSAASIAVLPEMDEVEVNIDMNEVRKDLYCASGPGGQSVNTTYSAVRLTHLPSGIVVQCQDEKSQHKNFDKALKVLRSRIYEIELSKHNAEVGAARKSMVGSGDRSEKIRTYNYPQSRVTDHRINHTVYSLGAIMDGDIDDFMDRLRLAENAERMKAGAEEAS